MAKSRITKSFMATVGLAVIFSSIFIFTNIHDWDFFFTTLEVDLRSLVLHGKLPSWSYQMCAGSNRAADPQSYGFSPLMILPVLFGSFWGSKMILLFSVLVGVYYLKKICILIDSKISTIDLSIYIFSFLMGNFFLFHFIGGHLSFSSIFLVLPLLHICLKYVLDEKILKSEFVINSIWLFVCMSGAFYQAAIYLIMPLALSFMLYLILSFKHIKYKDLGWLVLSGIIPLVLTAYRWQPVLAYQEQYPRAVNEGEWNGLIDQLLYFLIPVFDSKFILPFKETFYVAGEYSYLGAIPLGLIYLLFVVKKRTSFLRNPVAKISICFILVGVVITFGNKYSFLPFSLVNYAFNDSIRVVARFLLLAYLGMFCLFILIAKEMVWMGKKKRSFRLALMGVSMLLLFQHYSVNDLRLSMFQLKQIMNVNPVYQDKMTTLHVTKMRSPNASYMYLPTLLGMSVPNCYQPMARSVMFMGEKINHVQKTYDLHFLESRKLQPETCQEKSYFTQSDIHIDASCLEGTRVYLNFIEKDLLKREKITQTSKGYFL